MSELKEHLFCECDEIFREYRGQLSNEKRPYYLKSEADKEIQRLEKLCENYRCDCDNLAIMTDTMRKAGRTLRQKMNHQKRKRCLAMAKWCESEANYWYDTTLVQQRWHYGFYVSWCEKWLKLADQFSDKEA